MMPGELFSQQDFEDQASVIRELVEIDELGQFVSLVLSDGWEEAPGSPAEHTLDSYKIVLQHRELGLIAKVFAPEALGYATAAHAALIELGKLPLQKKILSPVRFIGSILFFLYGENLQRKDWDNIFSTQDKILIHEILTKHTLVRLRKNSTVDVVTVGETEYVLDPFDDSAAPIYLFLRSSRK